MKTYSVRVSIEAKDEDDLWNKLNNDENISNVCGEPEEVEE